MKGVIRIAGLEYRGFSYVYWNLYVVKEVVKRLKRVIGSTGITSFHVFFSGLRIRYRVDYILISCTSLSWNRLKKELEWRYVCVDPHFKFNKRRQWQIKTEVDFFKLSDIKSELLDVLIDSRPGDNRRAEFKISCYDDDCPFYHPYERFWVDLKGDYEENLEIGTQILKVERAWKRNGGEKRWRKRKAWKTENGNYKEVK